MAFIDLIKVMESASLLVLWSTLFYWRCDDGMGQGRVIDLFIKVLDVVSLSILNDNGTLLLLLLLDSFYPFYFDITFTFISNSIHSPELQTEIWTKKRECSLNIAIVQSSHRTIQVSPVKEASGFDCHKNRETRSRVGFMQRTPNRSGV